MMFEGTGYFMLRMAASSQQLFIAAVPNTYKLLKHQKHVDFIASLYLLCFYMAIEQKPVANAYLFDH